MTDRLTIRRPDDWHVHLRDGDMLRGGGARYRAPVRARDRDAQPGAAGDERGGGGGVSRAHHGGAARRRRLHPADDLLSDRRCRCGRDRARLCGGRVRGVQAVPGAMRRPIRRTASPTSARSPPRWRRCRRIGMPLLVHGEVTDPRGRYLRPRGGVHRPHADRAGARFPRAEDRVRAYHHRRRRRFRRGGGAEYRRDDHAAAPASSTATRCSRAASARTLIACRWSSASGTGWRCARRRRRGRPKFFLGTDSAPHAVERKETACGCAGIYNAAVRAGELCHGVRRGRRARPVRGVRQRARPALLRPAAE